MSDKSMFNSGCRTVSRKDTLCGCSYGYHTPEGMVRFECCRIFKKDNITFFARGPLYGKIIPKEDYDKLAREHGFTSAYSRNTCKFVMSRAARKRGYTTDDWMYNSKKERYSK